MKHILIFSAVVAIVLTACKSNETGKSGDVSQNQIYRKYQVYFDEASSTATASAVFRFAGENGTTLQLSSPAKITANGAELTEGKLLFGGAYYRNESPVSCSDNKVLLSYIDADENVLEESFEAGKASFVSLPDTFYLGKNTSISFSHSGNADSYEIMLQDKENRTLNFYARSNAEPFFEIPGSTTDTLAAGEIELSIISNKHKNLDNHSTLGGTADFSCTYKPVKLVAVKKKES